MSQFKLYEISDLLQKSIIAAFDAADQDTGELPQDWATFLDEVEMERTSKALDVARYIKSLDAEAEAVKYEEKKLTARRKALESKVASLTQYVEYNVQQGEVLKDANTAITWRKSDRVVITDEKQLPDDCFIVKREVSKTSIKEAIKKGREIHGAEIQKCLNMQIK